MIERKSGKKRKSEKKKFKVNKLFLYVSYYSFNLFSSLNKN